MERDRSSGTAEYTAAMRADHRLRDPSPVFDDPWALRLLEPGLRAAVESGEFRGLLERSGLRPTQGHIVLRARFADDALARAIARGVRQLVVLAAGLDSSSLRRAAGVRAIEVDHPATQRAKRERLAAIGASTDGVEFAAVDFEQDELAAALARTSFDPRVPAFVTWIGVSMYLPAAAGLATLAAIRGCLAVESELVFDYPVPLEQLDPEVQEIARMKNAGLARTGEPRIATFSPDEIARALESRGFAVSEDVGPAQLDARYCAGRRDGLRANPENRIVHARAIGR
jgi:methyltransferase (TIGR00027 family)